MEQEKRLIYGRQPVLEALRAGHSIHKIYLQAEGQGIPRELFVLAEKANIPVVRSKNHRLDKLVRGNHQGAIAELSQGKFYAFEELLEWIQEAEGVPLILALDQVQDPHNFGAILRSAEGSGCLAVLIPSRKSCGLSPAVSKSAAGADLHQKVVRVAKLAPALEELVEQGFQVVSTVVGASQRYWEVDLKKPTVILMGSEGEGVRPHLVRLSTELVSLPQLGQVESLNVSVASGILLYEVARQRLARS